ncbi:MAG: ATP-binding protein, partial [Candidatus Micrarchaeota archaeon]
DPRAANFEAGDFPKLDAAFREEFGASGCYFFDEIQNVPKWELFVRSQLDRGKHFAITGSNASLLSRELGTRLTGRHMRHELFPFSYSEYLAFTSAKAGLGTFNDYFLRGGFPEYLSAGKSEILQELFNDILARDIMVRHGLRSGKALRELAAYLLSNTGKEFSYNSLAKTFSLGSVNTAVAFVSYLEDSYLLFTVPKFDYSLKKQSVNPKKVYSIDNGFSNANSASFSSDKGRMLENLVFLELKRQGGEIFYFRQKGECDFLVRQKGKITAAYQACYELSEDNRAREVSGLAEAMARFGLREGLILTNDGEDELRVSGKTILVKPVWKWLLEGKAAKPRGNFGKKKSK